MSLKTMKYADFINVPNPCDEKILIEYGISENKIIVQPYGIFKDQLDYFKKIKIKKIKNNDKKKIVFIGTFDNRKGAVEFPQIINSILRTHSNVEFKLLGGLGMFPDEQSISHYIGDEFLNRVQIIGKYSPEHLPEILNDCTFGIFPSYLESFGFGVLEMMAMDIPVVGYDSPGINMLLLKELIVPPGNIEKMMLVFSQLINDNQFSDECILKCRNVVDKFIYENQNNLSITSYQKKLESRSL